MTADNEGAVNYWRQALWIIAAATLVRIVLAASVPLFADEAYYWEWSRRLAGGYFDHPPAIAYLISIGTSILGDTPLGVRIVPVFAGSFAAYCVALSVRHLAGERSARFAAIAFSVLPLSAAGLVLATPDAPLLAALSATLYALIRAIGAPDDREALRYWLLGGLAIGLAMASKFTGVFYPMATVIVMLIYAPLRRRIVQPGPWLAVVIASAVMIPVLWWNAQNDWIAFRFQLGHGLGTTSRGSPLQRELDLLGGQLGLVTPILFFLCIAAVVRAFRKPRDGVRVVLAGIAVFCAMFFVYSATRKSVEANWPAIAWLPTLILLASAAKGERSRWERRGVWLAGTLTVIALLHVVAPFLPLPARRDPVSKAHGWRELAAAVDSVRSLSATAPPVAANRYQDAAMLAFHLRGHPDVYALNLGARSNQYDIWERFADRAEVGSDMILVLAEAQEGLPVAIRHLDSHFAEAQIGPLVDLRRGDEVVGTRRIWLLTDWAGTWPADSTDPGNFK